MPLIRRFFRKAGTADLPQNQADWRRETNFRPLAQRTKRRKPCCRLETKCLCSRVRGLFRRSLRCSGVRGGGRDALDTWPSVPTVRGIQAYAEFAPAAKTKSLKLVGAAGFMHIPSDRGPRASSARIAFQSSQLEHPTRICCSFAAETRVRFPWGAPMFAMACLIKLKSFCSAGAKSPLILTMMFLRTNSHVACRSTDRLRSGTQAHGVMNHDA